MGLNGNKLIQIKRLNGSENFVYEYDRQNSL